VRFAEEALLPTAREVSVALGGEPARAPVPAA
jgi:hypothetical protein